MLDHGLRRLAAPGEHRGRPRPFRRAQRRACGLDSAAATAPTGAPAAATATAPTARVTGVAVAQKADHYTRVTIAFENATGKACKITGYTLSWDQGSKDIPLDNLTLAPGKTETRAMRVHAGEGDISRLVTPEGAKVVVHSDCAAP